MERSKFLVHFPHRNFYLKIGDISHIHRWKPHFQRLRTQDLTPFCIHVFTTSDASPPKLQKEVQFKASDPPQISVAYFKKRNASIYWICLFTLKKSHFTVFLVCLMYANQVKSAPPVAPKFRLPNTS